MMDNDISIEIEIAFNNAPFDTTCKCKESCQRKCQCREKTCDAKKLAAVAALAYVRIKWNTYKHIVNNGLVLAVLSNS